MAHIHQTAIVDPAAKLAPDVMVGPLCVVGPDVTLDAGVVLESHVVITGRTKVGARCRFFPFSSIGHRPQDLKYAGEPSEIIIGTDNSFREGVTINPGTQGGGMLTRIGNHCLVMANAHVAHDCLIGDHVILVNNVLLGGHVVIEDHAIVGGQSAVHQFVRIGRQAMIGGMTGVERDVIPYGSVTGDRAKLSGLNLVGLKRRGSPREHIHGLRNAVPRLFNGDGTLQSRIERMEREGADNPLIQDVIAFLRQPSKRGLCLPDGQFSVDDAA